MTTDTETAHALLGVYARVGPTFVSGEGVELIAGEALSDPGDATVMRTSSDGRVALTDGPYAEVIEGMGGFYLVEAPDLDVVVELLRLLPRYDIQIHPTIDVTP